MSLEQDVYKAKASALDTELSQSISENQALKESLDTQSEAVSELEGDVSQLEDQNKAIQEALKTWLTETNAIDTSTLTSEDLQKILDEDKTNQSLFQMDFIANQFYFVEISFDTGDLHQLKINGRKTNIQLTLDKRLNQEEITKAYKEIYDAIEEEMLGKKGGYRFVLFTVMDNGKVYRYAYDLVWDVLKDLAINNSDQIIYRLQYLEYE